MSAEEAALTTYALRIMPRAEQDIFASAQDMAGSTSEAAA